MIKAAFFDIDGTLVSHRTKSVPESAVKAIEMLKKNGIITAIASGRGPLDYPMLPISKYKFDYYVMFNGQACYDKNWKKICSTPIGDRDVLDRLFTGGKYSIGYVESDRKYINFVNDNARAAFSAVSTQIPSVGIPCGNPVYQAIIYINRYEEQEFAGLFRESRLVRWHEFATDVVANNGGKAFGIKNMLDNLTLNPDEIICFGDAENDLDMLGMAGISVAMGNALDSVKDASDYVTSDIDDNGIYNALKYFELI